MPGAPLPPKPAPQPPRGPRRKFHFIDDYRRLVHRLIATHPIDEAMSLAVGGQFDRLGRLERALLVQCGLKPEHRVIDVGCGSGRLAVALRDYLTTGLFIGTDVVQELLDYAKARSPAHWAFKLVEELRIPVKPESAEFVTFFSVFTHLLLHESYCYLLEARRVLKPGGRIVFSFLEFPHNWAVFETTYGTVRAGMDIPHLNEFIGRDAIAAWTEHLEMRIVEMHAAHDRFIVLDGEAHALGQSVCVLEKAA